MMKCKTSLAAIILLISLALVVSAYRLPIWTGGGVTLGNVTVVYTTDAGNATGNLDNMTVGFGVYRFVDTFKTPSGNSSSNGKSLVFVVDRINTSNEYYKIARNITWNLSYFGNQPTMGINITSIKFEMLGLNMNRSTSNTLVCWNSSGMGNCTAPTSIGDSDSDGYYEVTLTPTPRLLDSYWRLLGDASYHADSNRNISINISVLYWDEMIAAHTRVNWVEKTAGAPAATRYVLGAGSALNTLVVNSTFNLTVGNPFYNISFNVSYYLPTNVLSWAVYVDNNSATAGVRVWLNKTANATKETNTIKFNVTRLGYGAGQCVDNVATINISNETMAVSVIYSIPAPYLYANTTIEGPSSDIDGDISPENDFEREYVIRFNASKGRDPLDNVTLYNATAELSWNDKSFDDEFWAKVWVDNRSAWYDITPDLADKCGTTTRTVNIIGQNWVVCSYDRDNNERMDGINVTIPELAGKDITIRVGGEANAGRQIIVGGGAQETEVCGNKICRGTEDATSCPKDCVITIPRGQPFTTGSLPKIPLSYVFAVVMVIAVVLLATRRKE